MKNVFRSLIGIAGAVTLAVFVNGSALAQGSASLAAAKNDCSIGEGADGYLHVRAATTSQAVRRELDSINLKRKSAYTNLAKENGITVEVAAALTGEKLISRATAGQCVLSANGSWSEVN